MTRTQSNHALLTAASRCRSNRRVLWPPSLYWVVRRRAHAGRFEQEATEGPETDALLFLLSFFLWNWQPEKYCSDHADIFIRAHPCHLWFHSLRRGKAGRDG